MQVLSNIRRHTLESKKSVVFSNGIIVLPVQFLFLFSKASLTLEEKQKLAKEQEQAQKLKSQQPLKPQVHTPIAPVKQVRVRFFFFKHTVLKEQGSIELTCFWGLYNPFTDFVFKEYSF